MSSFLKLPLIVIGLMAIALHFILLGSPLARLADLPLLLTCIAGGAPLCWQILRRLAQKDLGADLLAALGLLTAVLMQEYLAGVLLVLMLAGGQALEAFAMRKASSALRALAERQPSTAHRKQGEHIRDIALGDIRLGDEIVIYPHESSPVDGTVLEGHGSMDESYLTGEPYQVSKAPGSAVLSGAINGEALLLVRTEKLPQDSRYARIMEVMQAAEQRRPRMRRLGDRLGALFVPVVLLFAAAAWYVSEDMNRFLAVLVIATPCPLLIAIPITVISAISRAAQRGIIIKDPAVLENLPTCRTAIFDKTGTLTYGQPALTEVLLQDAARHDHALQLAASLERYSRHPLAQALLKAAEAAGLFLPDAEQVAEPPGRGLTGVIDGKQVRITHRKAIAQQRPDIALLLPEASAGLECILLENEQYLATFRFRDTPRHEGKSFIGHLGPSHLFRKVMLVSGDRETEVNYLAGLLGIPHTLASQSPEQKLEIVRRETAQAPTLFMGDGINDAPALTAATVGLAFGQNTSVTAEAAGAVIMESSLDKVDELMHLSLAMRRIALQSAMGGILLSCIGMGFAAAGMITPVAGALIQELIDVLAILNALRLIRGNPLETDLHQHHPDS